RMSEDEHDVGHSPQTRSVPIAAIFARVQLWNILQGLASPPLPAKLSKTPLLAHCVGWHQSSCLRKRPSFLASRRFAKGKPDTMLKIFIFTKQQIRLTLVHLHIRNKTS
ncbi:MAG: hypothetical protein RBT60_14950, partial [Candidatus Krumholzibacteria bacterium]|nr:hypothetical protein [Candidatus Krumholzibacteria bacterium]